MLAFIYMNNRNLWGYLAGILLLACSLFSYTSTISASKPIIKVYAIDCGRIDVSDFAKFTGRVFNLEVQYVLSKNYSNVIDLFAK